MISQDGIIDVAEFCPSPNFDERPKNAVIDLIVIHAISLPVGCYNTQLIKDLFPNKLFMNGLKWIMFNIWNTQ